MSNQASAGCAALSRPPNRVISNARWTNGVLGWTACRGGGRSPLQLAPRQSARRDDDRLLPQFVATLMNATTPTTSLVFCNHHVIGDDGQRIDAETARLEAEYDRARMTPGHVLDPFVPAWRLAICPSAALVRRRDVVRLGFTNELNSADVEFFIRLAGESARFDFVPTSFTRMLWLPDN